MAQFAMIPGGGVTAATVTFGTTNTPTTVASDNVTVAEYAPNNQYVTVPPTAGLAAQDYYTGTKASLRVQFLQDRGETDSFAEFLEDNAGLDVYVLVTPLGVTDGRKTLYKVQAVAPGEGGPFGQAWLTEVMLPVRTRTFTPPA